MKKFIKYEIRGTYKFIMGIIAVILLASSVIQYNIFNAVKSFDGSGGMAPNGSFAPNGFLAFMFILSVFVIFGAFITAFFYIVSSFRKELYEDRGYLTFTLPLTGNQILGSKLIVALMWNTLIAASAFIFNLILGSILFKGELRVIIEEVLRTINISFLSSIVPSAVSGVLTLIIVYFAISLSKVSIGSKKIGGMWFIIFLIISGLVSYAVSRIVVAIPYYLDVSSFKIVSLDTMREILRNVTFGPDRMNVFDISANSLTYPGFINIAGFIGDILFAVGFFIATGYIIENRVEL